MKVIKKVAKKVVAKKVAKKAGKHTKVSKKKAAKKAEKEGTKARSPRLNEKMAARKAQAKVGRRGSKTPNGTARRVTGKQTLYTYVEDDNMLYLRHLAKFHNQSISYILNDIIAAVREDVILEILTKENKSVAAAKAILEKDRGRKKIALDTTSASKRSTDVGFATERKHNGRLKYKAVR
ncbi:MAG: hypothetical protein DRI98_10695 [Bacteroidetes bacterium]|nr:MAG: hypothetical protein DRI98_10695 [Bacteroidota bacterium]